MMADFEPEHKIGALALIIAGLLLGSLVGCEVKKETMRHEEIMNGKRPAVVNVPRDGNLNQ